MAGPNQLFWKMGTNLKSYIHIQVNTLQCFPFPSGSYAYYFLLDNVQAYLYLVQLGAQSLQVIYMKELREGAHPN